MRKKSILILLTAVAVAASAFSLSACTAVESLPTDDPDIVAPDDDDELPDEGEQPDGGSGDESGDSDTGGDGGGSDTGDEGSEDGGSDTDGEDGGSDTDGDGGGSDGDGGDEGGSDDDSSDIPSQGGDDSRHEHNLVYYAEIPATCTESGVGEYWYCADCGLYFADSDAAVEVTSEELAVPAAGHSYEAHTVSPTCSEEGYTEYICSACGEGYIDEQSYTDTLPHELGEWEIVTDSTCEHEGEKVRGCVNCSYTEWETIDKKEHDYVATVTEPTCTADGYTEYTCTACGSSYIDESTITEATGHAFGEWVTVTEPSCTSDGEKIRYCSACNAYELGELPATGHSYSVYTEEATCGHGEINNYICDSCGYSYSETVSEPLEHDYTLNDFLKATCTEAGYGEYACRYCGDSFRTEIEALGHDYAVTNEPATCLQGETEHYNCTRCGDSYSVVISDPADHVYSAAESVAATCTTGGYTYYECENCHNGYREESDPLGHELHEEVVLPTCSSSGYTKIICSRCDYEEIEEGSYTAPSGHTLTETVLYPADCENGGLIEITCEFCDYFEVNETDPLGHNFGSWETISQPGCEEEGIESRECTRCGATEERTISRLEHEYAATIVSPTCESDGYTLHRCELCGDEYEDTPVEALGHDYGDWITVKEPTCEEEGLEERSCLRDGCGETEEQSIAKSEHTYAATNYFATCENAGYTEYVCTVCGYSYTEEGEPALGHDFAESERKEPTADEDGYVIYTCTRCGDGYTETIPALSATEGIIYELSADGSYYIVTGIETGISSNELIIPSYYLNLPVTEISDGAFRNNADIVTVVLGGQIEVIGERAFYACTSLESVNIPESVTEIGEEAFTHCRALETIEYDAVYIESVYNAFGYAGMDGDGMTLVVGENVTCIPATMFYFYDSDESPYLVSVTFEEGCALKTVGDSAFNGCTHLTQIILPSEVEYVGYDAFYGCSSFVYAEVPEGAELKSGAFDDGVEIKWY